MDISSHINKMQRVCSSSFKSTKLFIFIFYRHLLFKANAFIAHILYFLSLSVVGFLILKALKPRTEMYTPSNIDLLYTSVSASTVSSMTAVEMEVFSNAQLLVMTVLMFAGGEIFTSMVRLYLQAFSMSTKPRVDSSSDHDLELSVDDQNQSCNSFSMKYDSIMFLGCVVLAYLLVVQILGVASVLIYLGLVSSAGNVLRNKGIRISTFAVFTIVSTFASCGFVPTNENMIVFSKNSGLLLILVPQIFLGNTMFPCALRVVIWILGRKTNRVEAKYLLKNGYKEIGFVHLLPTLQSLFLVATVFGFLLIGFVLFASMEWNAAGLDGLNGYRKVVGILFQCANSRHSGENIVDLSTIAPAILLFFIVMMYLPAYTSFLPKQDHEESSSKLEGIKKRKNNTVLENIVFSQLSYLALFIILICITERKSLKEDPLNFSVLNIIFEVISAYGNVGLSTGYSCDRQIRADPKCVAKWYGFSAKWSDNGKLILILVMFFGRLKHFTINGGKAWKLF